MQDNFDRVYSGNKTIPFVRPDAEVYFQDPNTYELMVMATSGIVLTKEIAKEEFGNRGLIILEKLIAEGWLTTV